MKDSRGRKRKPEQLVPLKAANEARRNPDGVVSKSHNIATTEDIHAKFKALSPRERGKLLEVAMKTMMIVLILFVTACSANIPPCATEMAQVRRQNGAPDTIVRWSQDDAAPHDEVWHYGGDFTYSFRWNTGTCEAVRINVSPSQ